MAEERVSLRDPTTVPSVVSSVWFSHERSANAAGAHRRSNSWVCAQTLQGHRMKLTAHSRTEHVPLGSEKVGRGEKIIASAVTGQVSLDPARTLTAGGDRREAAGWHPPVRRQRVYHDGRYILDASGAAAKGTVVALGRGSARAVPFAGLTSRSAPRQRTRRCCLG